MSRENYDADQAERVRRIQEEIRRKIAERRGQVATAPVEEAAPAPRFPSRPVFEEQPLPPVWNPLPARPPVLPPPLTPSTYEDSEALERQRRLDEQMEELETRRREARRAAQALAESGGVPLSAHDASAGSHGAAVASNSRSIAAELRSPQALRRAMVMREILGPPVALR
jgi:hypothetical protein